jgi:dTDP-4-amino-4,6-dideoxygalactose transaminase
MACGVKPGDEVITVANSDIATSAAISHCGATPVLCDVMASDYTIDVGLVEPLITERTSGLLPVDLYGHPADVRRLREIALSYDLFIVEDAAIATGATDYGKPVGSFADMAVFSCSTHKPFGGIGNGGLVVTEQRELWESVELLKGYGLPGAASRSPPVKYDHVAEGYNLTMHPINAAVLSVKLQYLKRRSKKRSVVGRWYEERLAHFAGIGLPSFRAESDPVFRTYSVRVRCRDQVYRILQGSGVEAALHYVPPIHLRPVYQGVKLRGSDRLQVTERLGEEMLCLPVDPLFGAKEVDYVCDLLGSLMDDSAMSSLPF